MLNHFDTEVRDYLADAGANVELLRLADHGVHGNGHGMIFERNHLKVLDVVMDTAGRPARRRAQVNLLVYFTRLRAGRPGTSRWCARRPSRD